MKNGAKNTTMHPVQAPAIATVSARSSAWLIHGRSLPQDGQLRAFLLTR